MTSTANTTFVTLSQSNVWRILTLNMRYNVLYPLPEQHRCESLDSKSYVDNVMTPMASYTLGKSYMQNRQGNKLETLWFIFSDHDQFEARNVIIYRDSVFEIKRVLVYKGNLIFDTNTAKLLEGIENSKETGREVKCRSVLLLSGAYCSLHCVFL